MTEINSSETLPPLEAEARNLSFFYGSFQALKNIDVDAIVADALNDPEVKQAMEEGMQKGVVTAEGIARNIKRALREQYQAGALSTS